MKATLPYFDVCISNTPYQISSPLVFRLLSHRPLFRVAILMFQKEFAARLVARPGDDAWSRLSANVQLYAEVNVAMDVGRNNFRPPPKVESTVVRLVPRDPPPPVEFGEFDGLARIVFGRRNKTVHANFMAKGVMDMLESNWKTWASVNDVVRSCFPPPSRPERQLRMECRLWRTTSFLRRKWRRCSKRMVSAKAVLQRWTSTICSSNVFYHLSQSLGFNVILRPTVCSQRFTTLGYTLPELMDAVRSRFCTFW